MKRTLTFNTSRLYQSDGQIITADYDPETEVVRFVDHSRMVEGEFQEKLPDSDDWWNNPRFFADRVMDAYDHNADRERCSSWIETDRDSKPQRQELVHLFRI